MATDLTVELLKQIRDGVNGMRDDFNNRIESLRGEVVTMREHVGHMDQRLERVEQRLGRVEQGLGDLGQFMRQIALDQAKHERFHAQHVEVLERDVKDLDTRVLRLEDRAKNGS